MIVYVNKKNEIKDVDTTADATLIPIEMPENNPFASWSIAKICCHKVILNDGSFVGFVPYVDSKLIEHIDKLGQENAVLTEQSEMLSSTVDSILIDIIPSLFEV